MCGVANLVVAAEAQVPDVLNLVSEHSPKLTFTLSWEKMSLKFGALRKPAKKNAERFSVCMWRAPAVC